MVAANRRRNDMKSKAGVPKLESNLIGWVLGLLYVLGAPALTLADDPPAFQKLAAEFAGEIRPILNEGCMKCHSTDEQKGTLDLEQFEKLEDVRPRRGRGSRLRRCSTTARCRRRTRLSRLRTGGRSCGAGWPII